ncbi:MAG: PilN domain-containing protein [bacterium]
MIKQEINLLPLDLIETRKIPGGFFVFLGLIFVGYVGFSVGSRIIKYKNQENQLNKEINSLEETKTILQKNKEAVERTQKQQKALVKEQGRMSSQLDVYKKLFVNQSRWSELLKEISQNIVENKTTWLTRIAGSGSNRLGMKGMTSRNSDIPEFIRTLEGSSFFNDIKLNYIKTVKEKDEIAFEFDIDAIVKLPEVNKEEKVDLNKDFPIESKVVVKEKIRDEEVKRSEKVKPKEPKKVEPGLKNKVDVNNKKNTKQQITDNKQQTSLDMQKINIKKEMVIDVESNIKNTIKKVTKDEVKRNYLQLTSNQEKGTNNKESKTKNEEPKAKNEEQSIYTIQIEVDQVEDYAINMQKRLKAVGYNAFIDEVYNERMGLTFRVMVGRYKTFSKAKIDAYKLNNKLNYRVIILKDGENVDY